MYRMSRAVLPLVLLAAAAVAGAWGVSSVLAPWPPAPARVPAVGRPAVVPSVRLQQLTSPPATGLVPPDNARNPFSGREAGRQEATAVSARAVPPVLAPVSAPPPGPAWPRLDLIGVAEVREGAGLIRTAVIAGPRGVHHARPGDLVEQVWRLERVTPDGADVRLVPEDRVVHLGLRR